MFLATEEKHVFVRWLTDQITSTRGLVVQMKLMQTSKVVTDKYEREIMACEIVRRMIESGEEMSITR